MSLFSDNQSLKSGKTGKSFTDEFDEEHMHFNMAGTTRNTHKMFRITDADDSDDGKYNK